MYYDVIYGHKEGVHHHDERDTTNDTVAGGSSASKKKTKEQEEEEEAPTVLGPDWETIGHYMFTNVAGFAVLCNNNLEAATKLATNLLTAWY